MSTRTRNPKKPTRKPKPKTTTPAQQPPATATPNHLPTRHTPRHNGDFITEAQIHAHYTAAIAGITPTRITGWLKQDDGTVRYDLTTGLALTYNHHVKQPLTAWTPCRQGVRHPHPIATRADLLQAQINAARCTNPHGTTPVRLLADRITLANEDTQQTDFTALRNETPQDHPHD